MSKRHAFSLLAACRAGGSSVAANKENEDRFQLFAPKEGCMIATVVDGHGGASVAQFVTDRLPGEIFSIMQKNKISSVSWAEAMVAAYQRIDTMLHDFLPCSTVEGSCAVTAVVTAESVTVANSGHARALLIDEKYFSSSHITSDSTDSLPEHCLWLSELHSADEASEQKRLHAAHPDEKHVVHCRHKIIELDPSGKILASRWAACYVKGLIQATRAFGHFQLKQHPTVPYIQARPATKKIDRVPGSVLILASDGLWDYLSPVQAAGLVGRCVKYCTSDEISEKLIERALSVAAESSGGDMGLSKLQAMAPGPDRRQIHDDITVVVILL